MRLLTIVLLRDLASTFEAERAGLNNALARMCWAEACRVAAAPGSAALLSSSNHQKEAA